MGRRKKDPPAGVSTSWESYRPSDDLYWRFGGPMVPVAEIPPDVYHYGEFGSTMSVNVRRKWIVELIEKAEDDMAEAEAYYLDLDARGIDALHHAWHRDEDRKLEESPNDWSRVARNLDRHRASTYRTIAMNRNKFRAYRAQLEALEVIDLPLFFGRS